MQHAISNKLIVKGLYRLELPRMIAKPWVAMQKTFRPRNWKD